MFYGTNHGLLLSMTDAKCYTQCLVVILEIIVFFAQIGPHRFISNNHRVKPISKHSMSL
jgi:hypothetical protein